MLIEERFPNIVGGKMPLSEALLFHAVASGVPTDRLGELVRALPEPILRSQCFFDLVSNLWRYEYGEPYSLSSGELLGPHVWQPVMNLVEVVKASVARLDEAQRESYMARLSVRQQHEIVLAEFIPIIRLPTDVVTDFEFKTGSGHRDVDWRLRRGTHPPVLLDVKRRIEDLLSTMERTLVGERREDGRAPQPAHDPSLLFRSIADKFHPCSPDAQLQGGWVYTALKQERDEVVRAFDALDGERVHFVILGGWQRGVLVLAKREKDVSALLDVFDEELRDDGYVFVRDRA